jgi:hypothetical protein
MEAYNKAIDMKGVDADMPIIKKQFVMVLLLKTIKKLKS